MIPSLAIQVQGQSAVTADNLNTYVQTCTTAAVLRTFVGNANMVVALQGIATVNDGKAGTFYWNATGTVADDNLNYIIPTAANPSGGEWVRLTATGSSITLSGDVSGPATTNVIGAGAVTASKIAIGAVGTTQLATAAVTSAQLAAAAVGTAALAANAVTNATMATMADQTVKANVSGGVATPTDVPISTLVTKLGITKFASPTHTPVSTGSAFSDAHGLGTLPSVYILQGYLKCLTAELGYSIGDVVLIASTNGFGGSSGNGGTVWANNTSVGMTFSTQGASCSVANRSTGQITNITPANWAAFATIVYFS